MIRRPSARVQHTVLLGLGLAFVLLGAAWRWHHLSSRPLHADEAVQAWQTWQLLRGEGYQYDPVDRHGPWLYFGAAALEQLRGGSAATLTDERVRTFSWLAGVATLAGGLFVVWRHVNPLTAVLAALLLAVSPLAVLYHTYFVQEAWFALFSWSLLAAGVAWLARPTLARAALVGACAGLMQVTKETSVLHFAALLPAFAWAARASRASRGETSAGAAAAAAPLRNHLGLAAGVALVIYALFYSSFGQHPAGLLDGLRTYLHQWQRAGDDAHTYPFLHYAELLWPHRAGGVSWGEPALLAAALAGLALVLLRPAAPLLRAGAVFTALLLLIYSIIPYKTPWLLLTPVIGLTLLAAHSLSRLARLSRWGAAAAVVATLATAGQLAQRTAWSLDRLPGDERNPYFYQQTPRGFTRLVERLEELRAAAPTAPVIGVVSPDYAWPLPWYARTLSPVGYYTEPPAAWAEFDAVIWDLRVPPPAEWPAGAVVELHGLRPNVLLYLVIQPALWSAWEAQR